MTDFPLAFPGKERGWWNNFYISQYIQLLAAWLRYFFMALLVVVSKCYVHLEVLNKFLWLQGKWRVTSGWLSICGKLALKCAYVCVFMYGMSEAQSMPNPWIVRLWYFNLFSTNQDMSFSTKKIASFKGNQYTRVYYRMPKEKEKKIGYCGIFKLLWFLFIWAIVV